MSERSAAMAVGQIARCCNQDCLNIFLMSANEGEQYRQFCPICRAQIFEEAFEQTDDEDKKSDA